VKLGSDGSGVGEGGVGELHDRSSVGSDSRQRTGRGESEPGEKEDALRSGSYVGSGCGRRGRGLLDGGDGKGVVRLGLGSRLTNLERFPL
jgi:hypothetical protein